MKRFIAVAMSAAVLAISTAALAAPAQDHDQDHGWYNGDHDHGHGHDHDHWRDDDHHDHGRHRGWDKHYRRGDFLPERYRGPDYYVVDYSRYNLYAPRPGYRWVRNDDGEFALVAIATGIIVQEMVYGH